MENERYILSEYNIRMSNIVTMQEMIQKNNVGKRENNDKKEKRKGITTLNDIVSEEDIEDEMLDIMEELVETNNRLHEKNYEAECINEILEQKITRYKKEYEEMKESYQLIQEKLESKNKKKEGVGDRYGHILKNYYKGIPEERKQKIREKILSEHRTNI